MTEEWVRNKNKEYYLDIKKQVEIFKNKILNDEHFVSDDGKRILFTRLCDCLAFEALSEVFLDFYNKEKYSLDEYWQYFEQAVYFNRITSDMKDLLHHYDYYLDTEPQYFEGDIIITDPCYIMKEIKCNIEIDEFLKYKTPKEYPDYDGKISKEYQEDCEKWRKARKDFFKKYNDFEICNNGYDLNKLGFTNYITRDTIYGDWKCTTFNKDTREKLGKFSAGAGLVSVMLYDEVLKYNPNYKADDTATIIKNFKGYIYFKVNEIKYIFEKEECIEYFVEVIGNGVNAITNKPLNFITEQTGL